MRGVALRAGLTPLRNVFMGLGRTETLFMRRRRPGLAWLAPLWLALSFASALAATSAPLSATPLQSTLEQAETLARLQTVIVSQHGEVLAQQGYRGHSTTAATNIKSASKLVMSALVGMAIDKGVLQGTEQRVAVLLPKDLPGFA